MRKAIRLGIVGVGFGQHVLVPAFRLDKRCKINAICASTVERAGRIAQQLDIPKAYGNWRALIADPEIDAVAIAVPPTHQPEIVLFALEQKKPVFCEKPLAATYDVATLLSSRAEAEHLPNVVDFEFPEIPAWQEARSILRSGGIGGLHHIMVSWNIETFAHRTGSGSWKINPAEGGGTLLSFGSHVFYYLEWFVGSIARIRADLFYPPEDAPGDTLAIIAARFGSGAAASVTISNAAFLGSGHRLEFYGDSGALVLNNPTRDYVKGFQLLYGTRTSRTLIPVKVDELTAHEDGRVGAVGCLAKRFIDSILTGTRASPDLRAGCRVQYLLDLALGSHKVGTWVDV